MHGSVGNAAPPPGPRHVRHLAEQKAPAPSVNPFAFGSDDTDSSPGPGFYAGYDSECGAGDCAFGGDIEEGDLIQAIGGDGFAHSECLNQEG